jgi:hypothetical protein
MHPLDVVLKILLECLSLRFIGDNTRNDTETHNSNAGNGTNSKTVRNERSGHAVAQLVVALCYKPKGSGFDSLVL